MKTIRNANLMGLMNQSSGYNSNYYYQKTINEYSKPGKYFQIFTELNKRRKLHTERTIALIGDKPMWQTTKKEVIRNFGYPHYQTSNQFFNCKCEVLLFKIKLNGFKTKLEVHLYRDRVFYYRYIFSYLSSQDSSTINNLLRDKYNNNSDVKFEQCKFINSEYVSISINDSIELSISYVHEKAEFFELVNDIRSKVHQGKEDKKKNEMQNLYNHL